MAIKEIYGYLRLLVLEDIEECLTLFLKDQEVSELMEPLQSTILNLQVKLLHKLNNYFINRVNKFKDCNIPSPQAICNSDQRQCNNNACVGKLKIFKSNLLFL